MFDFRFSRKVLNQAGEYERFDLEDYALRVWRKQGGDTTNLPAEFVDARSIPPGAHLEMQAVLQPYVDNAISKTINVSDDCTFDEFRDLYQSAYRHGLKGCTTFRSNPVSGEILSSETDVARVVMERDAHCCNIEREGE